MRTVVIVLVFALLAPLASAQESKSFWSQSLSAVNSTTPYPLASKETQDTGWFSATWDGTKRIWRDGKWDLYISGYTWHLPYAYTTAERHEENAFTYGLGIGKTLTDERDNQRSLYALVIEDSNYETQYTIGYTWMARWRLVSNIKGGLGYTAFITARDDTNDYLPFPAVAPLASIGTDRATVFATFIPGKASILYFFGKISFE